MSRPGGDESGGTGPGRKVGWVSTEASRLEGVFLHFRVATIFAGVVVMPVAWIMSAIFGLGALFCVCRGEGSAALEGMAYLAVSVGVAIATGGFLHVVIGGLRPRAGLEPSNPGEMWDREMDGAI